MYEIVRFLHKSLITEQSSIKDKTKLSKEYFDSGFWNLNQTTGDWFVKNSPPPLPPSRPKLPSDKDSDSDWHLTIWAEVISRRHQSWS